MEIVKLSAHQREAVEQVLQVQRGSVVGMRAQDAHQISAMAMKDIHDILSVEQGRQGMAGQR